MCYISSPGGTPDRTRSARENVADEQQDCTAQEKEGDLRARQRNLLVFCSTWSCQGRGKERVRRSAAAWRNETG